MLEVKTATSRSLQGSMSGMLRSHLLKYIETETMSSDTEFLEKIQSLRSSVLLYQCFKNLLCSNFP